MNEPNLFIIGAPKCATTSLYDSLAKHSHAVFPRVKEPGYFTRDFLQTKLRNNIAHLASEESYLRLFDDVEGQPMPENAIRCDGSTSYLRSKDALETIAQKFPQSKIIAVVRDPVQMVSSYYEFLKYEHMEVADTFEEAWDLQGDRLKGQHVPPQTRRVDALQYGTVALFGQQIATAKKIFGDRLLVLVFDDVAKDFPATSRRIQDFLSLPYEDLGELARTNPARVAKNKALDKFIKQPPGFVRMLRDLLKKLLGTNSLGLRKQADQAFSTKIKRVIAPEMVEKLRHHFADDVDKLVATLDRDLKTLWGWTR